MGGKKIESGVDINANGELDEDEISESTFVCNGAAGMDGKNGATALVAVSDSAPSEICPEGGKEIKTGLDHNSNNSLDSKEVTSSEYICSLAEINNIIKKSSDCGVDTSHRSSTHAISLLMLLFGISGLAILLKRRVVKRFNQGQ